ncbi:MAG: beta-propeller fold lactonase family protein [Propionibacteriaceae bacterium]
MASDAHSGPDAPSSLATHPRSTPQPGAIRHVIIGGYTSEMDGGARGVSTVRLEAAGADQQADELAAVEVRSPSYLIRHPSQPWLFATSEAVPGFVTSYRIRDDVTLEPLGTVGVAADEPCHLAVTPDQTLLVVANYGSGSVSSFAIHADGTLSEQLDLLQFEGSGPDPDRQTGPHAHQVVFDGDELLVSDLGTDRIHRLAVDADGRLSLVAPPVQLPSGAGPRHLVLMGDFLVVACELSAHLWLGCRTTTGWDAVTYVSSSTVEIDEPIYPSALVAHGSRVYVANRGAGTVAAFDLDSDNELLVFAGEFPCGGPWPRDLELSAGRLWVANQTNDVVSVFSTAAVPSGTPVLEFASPSPACLVLLP